MSFRLTLIIEKIGGKAIQATWKFVNWRLQARVYAGLLKYSCLNKFCEPWVLLLKFPIFPHQHRPGIRSVSDKRCLCHRKSRIDKLFSNVHTSGIHFSCSIWVKVPSRIPRTCLNAPSCCNWLKYVSIWGAVPPRDSKSRILSVRSGKYGGTRKL